MKMPEEQKRRKKNLTNIQTLDGIFSVSGHSLESSRFPRVPMPVDEEKWSQR